MKSNQSHTKEYVDKKQNSGAWEEEFDRLFVDENIWQGKEEYPTPNDIAEWWDNKIKEISRWTLEQVIPEEREMNGSVMERDNFYYNMCRLDMLEKAKEIGIELSTNSSEE